MRKNWRVFLSKSLLPRRLPRKPDWIRVSISTSNKIQCIKGILRERKLHTACKEAACPNLPKCFGSSTAIFMIMGDICNRHCPFCDAAHDRPNQLNVEETRHLPKIVADCGDFR